MNPRHRLGQHSLIDKDVLKAIIDTAAIRGNERVYEIGTGNGVLTAELCRRADKVVSCEIDRKMKSGLRYDNLTLIFGDGFKFNGDFDVFVSNLPYSKSRKAIEWLATRKFDRAVIMLQKEFAMKLLARQGSNYRAVSALAQHCFHIQIVRDVEKKSFNPRPKVGSVLLKIIPKRRIEENVILGLKLLFSHRGKTIGSVLKKFGIRESFEGRIEQLKPAKAIELAMMIEQKHSLRTI